MTLKERAQAEAKSREGSGPRIVTQDTIERLERLGAPEHLLKAAKQAIKTNPV